jgi:hypothetical protein
MGRWTIEGAIVLLIFVVIVIILIKVLLGVA